MDENLRSDASFLVVNWACWCLVSSKSKIWDNRVETRPVLHNFGAVTPEAECLLRFLKRLSVASSLGQVDWQRFSRVRRLG